AVPTSDAAISIKGTLNANNKSSSVFKKNVPFVPLPYTTKAARRVPPQMFSLPFHAPKSSLLASAAGLLTAARFFVDRSPRAALCCLGRNTALFVAVGDMLCLALLFFGVFSFVALRHVWLLSRIIRIPIRFDWRYECLNLVAGLTNNGICIPLEVRNPSAHDCLR